MDATVRPAAVDDIPAMHRIRLSVRENRLSDPDRIAEGDYLSFVDAGSAWVVERAGMVVGFAALDGSTGTVWALFVDPEAEGAGIGTALHDHMIEWARKQKLRRLKLSTAPGTRAERFYAAAGWMREGPASSGEVLFGMSLPNAVRDG